MYEILNEVPSEHSGAKLGRPAIYPWNDMQVNQSFIIEHRPLSSVRCQCYQKSAGSQVKFKATKHEKGVLVTRIA